MRTTLSALVLACAVLAGCGATTKKITLDPEIALRMDSRLTQPLPTFTPRESQELSEAVLLYEYTRLTNAYSMCYNDHTALIQLLIKELKRHDKE